MAYNLKKLISILAIATSVTLHAQEAPSFQLKIVQRPDGSVYWPLALPVYIHLGNDTTAGKSVLLTEVKDNAMKDVAIPMKWDGPGIHYLRHFDRLNHSIRAGEIAFPVHVDGAAPVTTLKLHGADAFISTRQYFGPGLKGTLSAADDMSGVETTLTSTDENPFIQTTAPVAFEQEKEYTLKYFSVDQVGNVEKTKSKVFTVDKTAPATTLSITIDNLDGKILSPRSVIRLSSTDKLSGVKKIMTAFDATPLTRYASAISPALLADGNHVLVYYAIDNVNNAELKTEYSFYLDRTAPVVTAAIIGPSATRNGKTFVSKSSTIRLTATDNKSGVKEIHYTMNGHAPQSYSSDFPIASVQGSYSIRFRGVDNVNNKGGLITTSELGNLFVDNTPPQVFHSVTSPRVFTRDTLFITRKSKITLGSIDNESGVAKVTFAIDGNPASTYDQPFTVSMDGRHRISYEGTDNVANSSSKQFVVVTDNVAPTVYWHFGLQKIGTHEGLDLYPAGTLLFLAATDNAVGLRAVWYSINGGTPMEYLQAVNSKGNGKVNVKVWAVDALGNESTPQVLEFVVK